MMKNATLCGVFVGSRAMFEQMNEAIAVNRMHPVVDRVFPFAEAVAAYDYHRNGKHFGKVVIRIAD
jgi:NADPH:quinone reductase-like Zn-dependent oxidoreductase